MKAIGIIDPRSVYEETVLLKFLEPNDDPRGVVLLAIYHVKYAIGVSLHDVFKENPGKLSKNPQ